MVPFLQQVARHYFPARDPDRLCFVFPNRRSTVFFSRYFSEAVSGAGRPSFLPRLYTMDAFFSYMYGTEAADRVGLLLELYDCYKEVVPHAEPLDEFIFWGDVLLADFDDADKYLVCPDHLFTNVADFKALQDTFSYLTPNQREALSRFASHVARKGEMAERFFHIWDVLLPLYRRFGERLRRKGMAYPGMIYRSLAERLGGEAAADVVADKFPGVETFVFVGLNALSESELRVLRKLRDASLAEFCWDFSSDWIRDPQNKASLFLGRQVQEFPQAFQPDPEGLGAPLIHVVSVPSSTGQAKQLPAILGALPGVDHTCAVVLPDESLLQPVLSSIPESVTEVNVTMGCPMTASSLYDLMSTAANLQVHMRQTSGGWQFYHRQVRSLLSNPLLRKATGEAGAAVAEKVRREGRYYVPQEAFAGCDLLQKVFSPVVTAPSEASAPQTDALAAYLLDVCAGVAAALREESDIGLELEFARRYWMAVNRLRARRLEVLPVTYVRLLGSLLSGASVPFRGEPLRGLQVMGPLETRALDFKNLVILSCNEGLFPRQSVSASFIPPEVRKGFDLPTYEYQDAVWAYYFYRLLQRSEQVWLLYDSRSEKLRGGEESRYIKQLRYLYGARLKEWTATSSIRVASREGSIPKSEADLDVLRAHPLSATALSVYVECPARFYYQYVCRLRPDEEISETLDDRMVGNVFHAAMERIYGVEGGYVDESYLESLKGRGKWLRALVFELICKEIGVPEVSGKNLLLADVIVRYVQTVLGRDIELMKTRGVGRIRILGLEKEVGWTYGGFRFTGKVDRLDSLVADEVRIVDYKTGGDKFSSLRAWKGDSGSKPALQFLLYDMAVAPLEKGKKLVNAIYPVKQLVGEPLKEVPVTEDFMEAMTAAVDALLAKITDPDLPYEHCTDPKTCRNCDFKNICGR